MLIDGWQRNREAPTTFGVPSVAELLEVKIGTHVKIGVEGFQVPGGPSGERFWVEVSWIGGHGTADIMGTPIKGIVRQGDMLLTDWHGIVDESTIAFSPQNILAIDTGES